MPIRKNIPKSENLKSTTKSSSNLLGRISIIVSIIASVVSIIYYVYGIIGNNNSVSLIINDAQPKKERANIIMNEMISNLQGNMNSSGNNISIGVLRTANFTGTFSLALPDDIYLEIENIFDITSNKKITSHTKCKIDAIGKRYFQDGKNSRMQNITTPGKILLYGGELLGYMEKNGVCDIFQINSTQLKSYINAVNNFNSLHRKDIYIGNIEVVGTAPTNTNFYSGPWNNSLVNLGMTDNPIFYNTHPAVLLISTHFNNDKSYPIGLIGCQLDIHQASRILSFGLKGGGNILEDKGRVIAEIQTTGTGGTYETVVEQKDTHQTIFPPISFSYFQQCKVKSIKILDSLGEEEIDNVNLE